MGRGELRAAGLLIPVSDRPEQIQGKCYMDHEGQSESQQVKGGRHPGLTTQNPQGPPTNREKEKQRCIQAGIRFLENQTGHEVGQGIDKAEVDGDQAQAQLEGESQKKRKKIQSPNPGDVHPENHLRRDDCLPAAQGLLQEPRKSIRRVLLELMQHVQRKLEINQQQRHGPNGVNCRHESQEQQGCRQRSVDPVTKQVLHLRPREICRPAP